MPAAPTLYPHLDPQRKPLPGPEQLAVNAFAHDTNHVVAIYSRWTPMEEGTLHRRPLRIWLVLDLITPPELERLDRLEAEARQRLTYDVELDIRRVGLRDRAPLAASAVCIWTKPRGLAEAAAFIQRLLA